ncbi:hypothetical protein IV203_008135 [Nitzschia inconspicua]|uniref:Methyltransferase n=1 Tax=Nitzschia inconspicua TaxID=303405 RepID=A0A9K3KYW1_9STRA|nr:hypothetical protein IV203_008135 [Nitzschia inconspicua]
MSRHELSTPANGRKDGKGKGSLLFHSMTGRCVIVIGLLYCVFYFNREDNASPNSMVSSHNLRFSPNEYGPSFLESYILRHTKELGYNVGDPEKIPDACAVWKDSSVSAIYDDLHKYRAELDEYNRLLKNYPGAKVDDVRLHLDEGICDTLEVKKGGLQSIFKSGLLSRVGDTGFVEPMLPPMRHPGICDDYKKHLMDMGYLVHDFGAMCRKLKRHSRTVFVDMGAALDFHKGTDVKPAIYVTHIYKLFGFKFDHIYAYELKPKDPKDVYERIPDELRASYHWFNVGVDSDPTSSNNPLKMIKDNFNEDDFIVVKLDIDTSSIEVPLAYSLLSDQKLLDLIDVFYFEHHVHMLPIWENWKLHKQNVGGNLEESLKLFTDIRKRGIASHSWP